MMLDTIQVNPEICQRFQSRRRQEHYLRMLNRLEGESRQSFELIYRLALTPGRTPEHITQAAIEAIKHPVIYMFAKDNILLRVLLKVARKRQDKRLIQKVEDILEDFHIATDAFMMDLSLSDSEIRRKALRGSVTPCIPQSTGRVRQRSASETDYKYFRRFAESLKANVQKARQYRTCKTCSGRKP
jgi:hypothetical protein